MLTRTKFIRVKCSECGSEQNTFSSASMKVKCKTCGKILVEPTGGKAKIKDKIVKVLS
ncbi:MAG: 30S ribosomal protein S27e [Candidatus Diapherotrites archaeon]|nr:30S ribosomal protein S27e [Candidatus Diapherotrites archaeon]